jgi:hypothetical protein
MNSIAKILLFLIPYQEATLRLPVDREIIRHRMATFVTTGLVDRQHGAVFFGQKGYKYTIKVDGYSLKMSGPYGYRAWNLVTQGKIEQIPEGSVLRLSQRLTSYQLSCALLLIVFYAGGTIFWLKFPPQMLHIIFVQLLFLWGAILLAFRLQAAQVLHFLKQTLTNSTQPT